MIARHPWALLAALTTLSAPAFGVAAPTVKSADLLGDFRARSASTPSTQPSNALSAQGVTVVVRNGSGNPSLPPGWGYGLATGNYTPGGPTVTVLNPNIPTRNAGGATVTTAGAQVTMVEESARLVQITQPTSKPQKGEVVDRIRDR